MRLFSILIGLLLPLINAQTPGYDYNGFTTTTLGCGTDSGALNVGLSQSLSPGSTGLKVKQIAFAIYGTQAMPANIQLDGNPSTARLSTSGIQSCCAPNCDLAVQVAAAGQSWYNSPCGVNSCGGSSSQNHWYYMDFSSSAVGTTTQTGISQATFYDGSGNQIGADMVNIANRGSAFFVSYTEIIPSPTPTTSIMASRSISPSKSLSASLSPSISATVSALPNLNFQATTIAGMGNVVQMDGVGTSASVPAPQYMVFTPDYSGIYISEASPADQIRLLNLTTNIVTSVAGMWNIQDTGTGIGTNAAMNSPAGLALDSINNILYAVERYSNVIRSINLATLQLNYIAGDPESGPGCANGIGTNALFTNPEGIAIDQVNQFLYVADTGCAAVRAINISTQNVTTPIGTLGVIGWQDVYGGYKGKFGKPTGIRYNNMNLYVTDTYWNNIRYIQLSSPGIASSSQNILGGNGPAGTSIDGSGTGVSFNNPMDLEYDGLHNALYVSQAVSGQSVIRKISLYTLWNAQVITLSGNNITQSIDGTGTQVSYNNPIGLIYNPNKNTIYTADSQGNVIRQLGLTLPSVTPTVSSSISSSLSASISVSASIPPTVSITPSPTATLPAPWFTGMTGCCHNPMTSGQAISFTVPSIYSNTAITSIALQYWPGSVGSTTFTIGLMAANAANQPTGSVLASAQITLTSPGSFPGVSQQAVVLTNLGNIVAYSLLGGNTYSLVFYGASNSNVEFLLGNSGSYIFGGGLTPISGSFYTTSSANPPTSVFWYTSSNTAYLEIYTGPVQSVSVSPSISISPSFSSSISATSSISNSNIASSSITPSSSLSTSYTSSVSQTTSSSKSYSSTMSQTRSSSITPSISTGATLSISPSISYSSTVSQTRSSSVTPSISSGVTSSISPSVTSSIFPSTSVSTSVLSSVSLSTSVSKTPTLSPSIILSISGSPIFLFSNASITPTQNATGGGAAASDSQSPNVALILGATSMGTVGLLIATLIANRVGVRLPGFSTSTTSSTTTTTGSAPNQPDVEGPDVNGPNMPDIDAPDSKNNGIAMTALTGVVGTLFGQKGTDMLNSAKTLATDPNSLLPSSAQNLLKQAGIDPNKIVNNLETKASSRLQKAVGLSPSDSKNLSDAEKGKLLNTKILSSNKKISIPPSPVDNTNIKQIITSLPSINENHSTDSSPVYTPGVIVNDLNTIIEPSKSNQSIVVEPIESTINKNNINFTPEFSSEIKDLLQKILESYPPVVSPTNDNKIKSPDDRPTSPDNRPTSPVNKPTSPDNRPTSPDNRPTSPVNKPISPDNRPISPVNRPTSPVNRPTSPDNRPTSPVIKVEPKPAQTNNNNKIQPPTNNNKPVYNQQSNKPVQNQTNNNKLVNSNKQNNNKPKARLEVNAEELAEIKEMLAKRNKNYKVL